MREAIVTVLDHLETKETALITWGDTAGYFSTQELIQIIEELLPDEDPEDVEDELRDSALVIPVLDGRGIEVGVRTRMAEALHLFRNLRQWFIGQNIARSRTLVSDYRFVRSARRYPRRDIDLKPLLENREALAFSKDITARFLAAQAGNFQLAGFQVRATKEILSAWEERRYEKCPASATIVCAGTGSGKTLAFYLPALSALATDLVSDSQERVRILAIYPRRELLKDQFNETWGQARRLDAELLGSGSRKIRIGALFGETPSASRFAIEDGKNSRPFSLLKCQSDSCSGKMRWTKEDATRGVERLICASCGHEVRDDEIALTRESAAKRPPDILFTTTEMLNQRMSDSKFRHLFGIKAPGQLPLVLLDEVHTYGGVQGAHTGLLLRRWMRLSGNRPHFVGLSATLRDAGNFFSTLTSAPRTRVQLVEPMEEELIEEGAEYLLALRGDPVSQTALLSTTTQTAMLTRRILDNPSSRVSNGLWGTKTFTFTDNLDVNNRLFSALADAEGWWQRPAGLQANRDGPLAQLRNSSTTTVPYRELRAFGQDWSIAKACGFSLAQDDRARVARTSSQDAGFDSDADIVVTTASLEVGFNDPDVGAVIQHKAPHDVSSYLQRKGRAGRQRRARPWMICVLSEFGRDRTTYQQYENLIDPQIKLQGLPVENVHLLKMQAAQAALDWFGSRLPNFSVWSCLNNPQKNDSNISRLLDLVTSAMQPGPEQDMLQSYIQSALKISDTQLERVMWQAPRSLLLEFLPTLARRLSSKWAIWSDDLARPVEWAELPTGHWHSPVPDFIPDSSFAELDVPEIQIRLERRAIEEWQGMSFFQGIREFAPGRISKRFAVTSGAVSDWLVPSTFNIASLDKPIPFEVHEAFGPHTAVVAQIVDDAAGRAIAVYQPHSILTTSLFADKTIADTSNAFLTWESIFSPPTDVDPADLPRLSAWSDRLKSLTFYTHARMSPLDLVRLSTGSDATIKFKTGQSTNVRFDWVSSGTRAAIGTRQFPDGLRCEFRVSDADIDSWLTDASLVRALRVALLQDKLLNATVFEKNTFTANWAHECFLAAVVIQAIRRQCDLPESVQAVCESKADIPLTEIPKFLFQLDLQEYGDQATDDARDAKEQELQRNLRDTLSSTDVLSALQEASKLLYAPLRDFDFLGEWIRKVLANTLCAALQQTVCNLLPNVDDRSIRADWDSRASNDDVITIWLTESQTGGIGVIDQFEELFYSDPIRVLRAFHSCLQPGDYEQADTDLFALLEDLTTDDSLDSSATKLRNAETFSERLSANREFRQDLSARGYLLSHTFSAVMHSRVLRPGSNRATDQHLFNNLRKWREIEDQCGLELPMQTAAFVISASEEKEPEPSVIFTRSCELQSTFWTRGAQVRQSALQYYNEFNPGSARTERLLGAAMWREDCATVRYDESDWIRRVHKKLDQEGQVDLIIERKFLSRIGSIMATLHIEPIEVSGLEFYPRVEKLTRNSQQICMRLSLAEAIH